MIRRSTSGQTRATSIGELVYLFIGTISIVAVALLLGGVFSAILSVTVATVLTALTVYLAKLRISFNLKSIDGKLLLLLFLALVLRLKPYLWIMGNQDQGVYVSASAVFERQGGIYIKDGVREGLSDDERKIYDQTNQLQIGPEFQFGGDGWHMPGVYALDLKNSTYVFQFFPLHSLWLAIFGKFFGGTHRVWSVVFFSILSIVSLSQIAVRLSGRPEPGWLVAGFLAINPIHLFFSKFPTTETTTLAFSGVAFLSLLTYYQRLRHGQRDRFSLLLAWLFFSALFLTHIATFLYMPFFYFIFATVLIFEDDFDGRRDLVQFCAAVFLSFAASVLIGLHVSFPYSNYTYSWSFGDALFGKNWVMILPIVLGFAALLLPLLALSRRWIQPWHDQLRTCLRRCAGVGFTLILLYGFWKGYQLGFTNRIIKDEWALKNVYHTYGNGFASLLSASSLVYLMYLSPFGLYLFYQALARSWTNLQASPQAISQSGSPTRGRFEWECGLAFVMIAMAIRIFAEPIVLYQYYYARYLLAEVIPYSFVMAAALSPPVTAKSKPVRAVGGVLFAASFLFFCFLTSRLLMGREAAGVEALQKQIARHVAKDDLLIIDGSACKKAFELPMSYYFGLNTFSVTENSQLIVEKMKAKYTHVYVLTNRPLPTEMYRMEEQLDYREPIFNHGNLPAMSIVYQNEMPVKLFLVRKGTE